jgi:hypothetical protein
MSLANSAKRLLVEGSDDKWSIINLLSRHGIACQAHEIFVQNCEGLEGVLESAPVAAKTYHSLGILLDASFSLKSRWERIADRLKGLGIEVPNSPDDEGTIIHGIREDYKVGIWLMPDNNNEGKLEDFLGSLVPPEDKCWLYTDEATRKAKDLGASFSDSDFIKARVHNWLAWQEKPGLPFGTAINARFFNHDSEVALAFVKWFRNLFSLS